MASTAVTRGAGFAPRATQRGGGPQSDRREPRDGFGVIDAQAAIGATSIDGLWPLTCVELRGFEPHTSWLGLGHVDELTARMPGPDEIRTLDLAQGVPVIVYVRTAWTNQRPVRVTRTVFPADRKRIVYELGDLGAYEGDQS